MLKISSWRTVFLLSVFCTLAVMSSPAQTLTTLYSFCSQTNCTDGAFPEYAPLVQGADGNLYGTTGQGGLDSFGTVFKITPRGKLTTLYSFTASQDGSYPDGGLTLTASGIFYGTSSDGGGVYGGAGAAFKITSAGKLTPLYDFGPGGWAPEDTLVQARDGNFYGTTLWGGRYDYGTVFKLTPSGELTYIYSFCSQQGCSDGVTPYSPLVQGTDGNLYGTTSEFGANGTGGTVFKITTDGVLTTLHNFCAQSNCADGAYPYAGLVQAADGNFYGTTFYGGTGVYCPGYSNTCGTVFKITPGGQFSTLHNFCSQAGSACPDGAYPFAGLIQATDGKLYGTTYGGGSNGSCGNIDGCGTVFQIATTGGALTVLHQFCSEPQCTDGWGPTAAPVEDTSGTLYGITDAGGNGSNGPGSGTVFSLSVVGLGAFVRTVPTSGKVGTEVTILGNNLTGSTSVTFNGVAAKPFSVNSTGTAITTTVPTGATTGYVQVTTPSGTLTSNLKFRVP